MNKKKERKVFPGYGNIWAEASPFGFDLPYCIANGRDESSFFFSFALFELKYILNIFSFFPLKMHSPCPLMCVGEAFVIIFYYLTHVFSLVIASVCLKGDLGESSNQTLPCCDAPSAVMV